MKTTLRYSVAPFVGRKIHRQQVVSKIRSGRGVLFILTLLSFSYACLTVGHIPWKMGLAPTNGIWEGASFVFIALGVFPLIYMMTCCILFAVRNCILHRTEANAPSVQVTLVIDDDGLTFVSETGEKGLAWDGIKDFEVVDDFFVFSCRDDCIFIPRKEIPHDIQAFIKGKTVHAPRGNIAKVDFGADVAKHRGIYVVKLILYATLLVFATGIILMLAGVLSWTIFM